MPQDHPVLERPEHATKPPTVSLLFVYGTLRMGGSNDIRRFGPYSRLLGPARVRGRLYDLGDYPGLVLGGLDWVSGELHAIAPEIEPALDALEADHAFLLKGDVFTSDVVQQWIAYKRIKEVDAMRLRPHPYEFCLYFDA
jgi:gamma-glutamylcyclotransferase (GGCT)/AIG2-like uncharacterized protein YtfP